MLRGSNGAGGMRVRAEGQRRAWGDGKMVSKAALPVRGATCERDASLSIELRGRGCCWKRCANAIRVLPEQGTRQEISVGCRAWRGMGRKRGTCWNPAAV